MLVYWQAPILSVGLMFGLALFALWQGGRSGFLCLLLSVGLMAMIGGRVQRLKRVARNFLLLLLLLIGVLAGAKWIYEDVVQAGYMGEDELRKYEEQKNSRIGLLSGRGQLVVAFFAVADSPILGHGSWPVDYDGYNQKAAEVIFSDQRMIRAAGQLGWIDTHSHVWTAWVWHGVLGGIFWFYILGVLWRTLSHRLAVAPLLFGYLAYSIPQLCWAILFSPFGSRVATTVTIVTCLLVRNVERMQRSLVVAR
jgi:O-antigen ligase